MQNHVLASLLSNMGLDSRTFHLLNLVHDMCLGWAWAFFLLYCTRVFTFRLCLAGDVRGGSGSLGMATMSFVSKSICSSERPESDAVLGPAAAAFGFISPPDSPELHGCVAG